MITRLKQLRKFLNLSQRNIAQELGITQTAYSMIETGRNPFSDRYIKVICSIYSVNEAWLRTGEGEMFSSAPYSKEFSEVFNQLWPETQIHLLCVAKDLLLMQEKFLERVQEQQQSDESAKNDDVRYSEARRKVRVRRCGSKA